MDPPLPGSYPLLDLDPPAVVHDAALAIDRIIDENFPPPPNGDFLCNDFPDPLDASVLFPELMREVGSACGPDSEAGQRMRLPGTKKNMRYPHMAVDVRPRKRRKGAPVYREEDTTSVESDEEEDQAASRRTSDSTRVPLKPSSCGTANADGRRQNLHIQSWNDAVSAGAPSHVKEEPSSWAPVRPTQPPRRADPNASSGHGRGNRNGHSRPPKHESKRHHQDLRQPLHARKRPMKSTYAERKLAQRRNKSGAAKEKPCLPTPNVECTGKANTSLSEECALLSRLQQDRSNSAALSSNGEKENFLSQENKHDERVRDHGAAMPHRMHENAVMPRMRQMYQSEKSVVRDQKQRHMNQEPREATSKQGDHFPHSRKNTRDELGLNDARSSRIDEVEIANRRQEHTSWGRPDARARPCGTSKVRNGSYYAPSAVSTEHPSADRHRTLPCNNEHARNAVRPIRKENRKSRDEFLVEEQTNRSKVLHAMPKPSIGSEKRSAYIVGKDFGRALPQAPNCHNKQPWPRVPVGQQQTGRDDRGTSEMFDYDSGKLQRHAFQQHEELEKTVNDHLWQQKQAGMSKGTAHSYDHRSGHGLIKPTVSKRSFKGGSRGNAGRQGRFKSGMGRR